MTEPVCTNVEISVTSGGSVQIVKFNLRNDFGVGYTETYTIPAEWDADRIAAWKLAKTIAIKERADEFAQVEQDALLEMSDWYEPVATPTTKESS